MATFRSRNVHPDRDGRLGRPGLRGDDFTTVIPNLDLTVLLPRAQRPVRIDRPLLPVWLFRSLVAGVFSAVYSLILIGLFLIFRILFIG